MKIYFGFTVAGDRSSVAAARHIVTRLKQDGHTVLTEHLVEDNAWAQDRQIPAEIYRRDMRWLEECDLFIAEVSGSSFGLGFEAGYILGSSSKRAILFYRLDAASRVSLLITGNAHPNCTAMAYSDIAELDEFLASGLPEGPKAPASVQTVQSGSPLKNAGPTCGSVLLGEICRVPTRCTTVQDGAAHKRGSSRIRG